MRFGLTRELRIWLVRDSCRDRDVLQLCFDLSEQQPKTQLFKKKEYRLVFQGINNQTALTFQTPMPSIFSYKAQPHCHDQGIAYN